MEANSELDKAIGLNIGKARAAAGMTQGELGAALPAPCTYQQISKYERGINTISAVKLMALAGILQVPVLTLLEGCEALVTVPEATKATSALVRSFQALSPQAQSSLQQMIKAFKAGSGGIA